MFEYCGDCAFGYPHDEICECCVDNDCFVNMKNCEFCKSNDAGDSPCEEWALACPHLKKEAS